MDMRLTAPRLIAFVLVVAAAGGYLYYVSFNESVEAPASPPVSASTTVGVQVSNAVETPVDKMPETNPFKAETNPYTQYKNPFE